MNVTGRYRCVNSCTHIDVAALHFRHSSRRTFVDRLHDSGLADLTRIDVMPSHRKPPSPRSFTCSLICCALLLAGWSAFASAQCNGTPSPEEALRRLNAERARGVVCSGARPVAIAAPLRWNPGLAAVAAAQAEDMAALRQMGHRDRLDRPLPARLTAVGYRFSTAVENVAFGYPSLDTVVDAWLASEVHCVNLMNAAVLELGLACSDGGGNEADRYWTLVLGAPRR